MLFTTVASAVVLAGLVAAQDQTVVVGGTSPDSPFTFTPANITATANSVITFEFRGSPGNHTVTQSTFSDPCNPAANGFDSGWVFIPPSTTAGFPQWKLTITNASKPLWYYCKQLAPSPHCNVGMVGSINAPATGNTFDAYVAAAKAHQGASGQGTGLLVGNGASASGGPGPFSGSITGYGVPTGTAATTTASSTAPAGTGGTGTGTGTGTAPPSNSSKAAAMSTGVNALTVFFAALFGIALA